MDERKEGDMMTEEEKRDAILGGNMFTSVQDIRGPSPLYAVAEKALNVYLDAHRKAVGSPSETLVSWYFLNALRDELVKIFPHHPEL